MKKTELIKNAINQAVEIEYFDGETEKGYVVKEDKNTYMLLPFDYFNSLDFTTFKVSQVKHIRFINNNYKLW